MEKMEEKFNEWIEFEMKKRNSTIMGRVTYNELISYLEAKRSGTNVKHFARRIAKSELSWLHIVGLPRTWN